MVQSDRNVQLTLDAKNAVESYIYDMRSKVLGDGPLAAYLTPAARDAFAAAMEQTEEWLYGEGEDAPREDYEQRLSKLKGHGSPAAQRQADYEAVPAAAQQLHGRVADLREKALNADGSRSHVPAEELQGVVERCTKAAEWLREEQAKQQGRPRHEPPALTAALIQQKLKDLEAYAKPILEKPKPKPKEEEKPAAPAAPAAEGAAAPGAEAKPKEQMDLD